MRAGEIVSGLQILFAIVGGGFILGVLAQTAERSERNEASIATVSTRIDRVERRQRELDERIDHLSSALRATVRPIGWDVPDGGR